MINAHTLTTHRDIQDWVSTRHGMPAIAHSLNSEGRSRAKLLLRFDAAGRPRSIPKDMPRVDEGVSPVSWSAWLAELDRQQLALRVIDDTQAEYELVARKDLN